MSLIPPDKPQLPILKIDEGSTDKIPTKKVKEDTETEKAANIGADLIFESTNTVSANSASTASTNPMVVSTVRPAPVSTAGTIPDSIQELARKIKSEGKLDIVKDAIAFEEAVAKLADRDTPREIKQIIIDYMSSNDLDYVADYLENKLNTMPHAPPTEKIPLQQTLLMIAHERTKRSEGQVDTFLKKLGEEFSL